jgi:hypothetical protein
MDRVKANTKKAILGVVLATGCASGANATIIYNTPGTTNVTTTVIDNVIVDNAGRTVNVGTGGTIRGVSDPSLGIYNAAVRTRAGTLNVNGTGRVIAAAGQDAISMTGNPSVVRLSNYARVSGNIVNEFTLPGWRSESTSLVKLYLEDNARVTGNIRYAGYMRIEDSAQVVGSIINPSNGSYSLDMRGGLVTGQVQMGGLNDYVFNMSGGTIFGGVRGAAGYVDMIMTGGTIHNGFQTGDAVTADIFGGSINGGLDFTNNTGAASHITIDGGQFNATAGDYLFSMSHQPFGPGGSASLDIYGGEFGYVESGLGFFLDYLVDFSIYGWDLTYTGGVLSGYLLDGNWFSNAFTFGADWAGTFNIHNLISPLTMAAPTALTASLDPLSSVMSLETQSVPEPGTLGLLAACAFLMSGARYINRRNRVSAGPR